MSDKKKESTLTIPPGALTVEQAAEWLGISRTRLFSLPIPKVKYSARCIRYRVKDLQFYMDTHMTSEALSDK